MNEKARPASIKSIAQELGLSPTTVSLVLNGQGDRLRIAPATQERILAYTKDLHYQPNIYAKRLRKGKGINYAPLIAVFWPTSFNSSLINRFFLGIQQYQDASGHKTEIMLQPYHPNQIAGISAFISSDYYSGAILLGLSETDFAYITEHRFDIPLVLLNRSCDEYSAVCVDDSACGKMAAELFYQRGHRDVALINYGISSRSSSLKTSGFAAACREYGIRLTPEHIISGAATYEGGYAAANALCEDFARSPFTAVFIQESSMAVGALPVFRAHGIDIPHDMELLSYGDNPHDAYMSPSLTSFRMPVEEMAFDCVKLVYEQLDKNTPHRPSAVIHPIHLIVRESCGGFDTTFS